MRITHIIRKIYVAQYPNPAFEKLEGKMKCFSQNKISQAARILKPHRQSKEL